MRRVTTVEMLVVEILELIADLNPEHVCHLYNTLSPRHYAEYYADGVITVNDKLEQAS